MKVGFIGTGVITEAIVTGLLDSEFLQRQGATEQKANKYLSGLFHGLAKTAMQRSDESFSELKTGHCTPGGLNEQFADVFMRQGGGDALEQTMQSIQDRILKV